MAMSPADAQTDRHRQVLLLSPPLEEYARTIRALVGLRRHLESKGHTVAHWSPGAARPDRTEHLVVSELDAGVTAAIRRLGGAAPVLVGLRFGAYLAVRAVREGNAARAVLWEPALDPAQYLREAMRISIANQLTTYGSVRFSDEHLLQDAARTGYLLVDGYRLTQASLADLKAAPSCSPESLADSRPALSLLFWRNKRAFERWRDAGFDAAFVPDVKLAWDSIRYFDANPVALFEATAERVTR